MGKDQQCSEHQMLPVLNVKYQPHGIHVRYIYLHVWLFFMVNVGKYTSPMDFMGMLMTSVGTLIRQGMYTYLDGLRFWVSKFSLQVYFQYVLLC